MGCLAPELSGRCRDECQDTATRRGGPFERMVRTRLGSLDLNALAVDGILTDPTVDEALVVADLIAMLLDRLDQVQVLVSRDLAQNDVANGK